MFHNSPTFDENESHMTKSNSSFCQGSNIDTTGKPAQKRTSKNLSDGNTLQAQSTKPGVKKKQTSQSPMETVSAEQYSAKYRFTEAIREIGGEKFLTTVKINWLFEPFSSTLLKQYL